MEPEAAQRIFLKGRDKSTPKKTNNLFAQSPVTNTSEMSLLKIPSPICVHGRSNIF